jgi:hypothetical protein
MVTTTASVNYWRAWAVLLAAITTGANAGVQEVHAAPEHAMEHRLATAHSRDLLTLHREIDPGLFRCHLCRPLPTADVGTTTPVRATVPECRTGVNLRRL